MYSTCSKNPIKDEAADAEGALRTANTHRTAPTALLILDSSDEAKTGAWDGSFEHLPAEVHTCAYAQYCACIRTCVSA